MCENNCLPEGTSPFVESTESTASPSPPDLLPSPLMAKENTCIFTFFLTDKNTPSFLHLIYNFQMLADLDMALEGHSNKGKVSALPLFSVPLHSLPGFLRKDRSEGV